MSYNAAHQVHPRSVSGARSNHQAPVVQVHSLLRAIVRISGPGTVMREEELTTSLGATRKSIRDALQLLAEEGLVTRQRRAGTVVVGTVQEIPGDEIIADSTTCDDERFTVDQLGTRVIRSNGHLARLLGARNSEVHVSESLVRINDRPSCIRTSYVANDEHVERLITDVAPLEESFAYVFGTSLGGVESTIEAITLEPRTAALLGLPAGSPGLMRELVLRDRYGAAREISFTVYRGDAFAIRSSGVGDDVGGLLGEGLQPVESPSRSTTVGGWRCTCPNCPDQGIHP
jgi:GntR family transcriptional regulator